MPYFCTLNLSDQQKPNRRVKLRLQGIKNARRSSSMSAILDRYTRWYGLYEPISTCACALDHVRPELLKALMCKIFILAGSNGKHHQRCEWGCGKAVTSHSSINAEQEGRRTFSKDFLYIFISCEFGLPNRTGGWLPAELAVCPHSCCAQQRIN